MRSPTIAHTIFHLFKKSQTKHINMSSQKHLHTEVTPDLQLTYSKKTGEIWVDIKKIKSGNFSIK